MRQHLVTLLSAVAAFAFATTATAQEVTPEPTHEGVSLSVSTSIESGRIFQDQAFNLTDRPVGVVDFTFTHEPTGVFIDFWAANNGHSEDREEDVIVGITRGPVTLQVGWYELPGPEVWDFKLAVSVPLTDRVTFSGYAEVMRGGFVDEIVHGDLTYAGSFGNRWNYDLSAGMSYATSTATTSVTYEAGVSYGFENGATVRAFVKGYTASIDTATIVGVGFNRTFTNVFGN